MFSQSEASERRQFVRSDFTQPVELGFPVSAKLYGSLSADLSTGGVRLNVNQFIAPQTELTVRLQFKDKRAIDVPAKVVWAEQKRHSEWYQVGLEFLNVDAAHVSRRWIAEWTLKPNK